MKWLKTNYVDMETGEVLGKKELSQRFYEIVEERTDGVILNGTYYKQTTKLIKTKGWKPIQMELF